MSKRMANATARLLLVHWHSVVLRGLAACLGQEPDFELVGLGSTCEQALVMAAELHPDLVLIGYSTPVMGGVEVTRRLIEADPDILVVLIGVMAGPERTERALESGAMGYVLLETPPQELVSLLRGFIRGKDTKRA